MAIRAYHSGASYDGGWQPDAAACLGGYASITPCEGLTAQRYTPMRGVRIEEVSGDNGDGIGILEAVSSTSLRWTPPGETTAGTAVEVAVGETAVLTWGAAHTKCVMITRVLDVELSGIERVHLVHTYNTGIVGANVVSETDSLAAYAAVILKNEGDAEATVTLTVTDQAWLTIGTEATVAGAVQTIADRWTAPTGVTFAASAGPVAIPAGGTLGLWVKQTFTGTVTARRSNIVSVAYEIGALTGAQGALCGLVRRGKLSEVEYRLYVGVDGEPDFEAAPDDTAATVAGLTYQTTPGHEYRWQILRCNEYGLLSPESTSGVLEVDAEGNVATDPPSAPVAVAAVAQEDGTVLFGAQYLSALDAADVRATEWALYITEDGTTPTKTTPTVVQSVTGDILEYEYTPTGPDETPIKAIVCMKRGTAVSTNTDVVTTAIDYAWLAARPPRVVLGRTAGQAVACGGDQEGTVWIDQARNVRWEVLHGRTRLYADSVLCLTITGDVVSTDLDIEIGDVTGTGAGAVEVGTWTAETRVLWLNVAGSHAVEIDVIGGVITAEDIDLTAAVHARPAHYPAWLCYEHTTFQEHDAISGAWETVMSIDTASTVALVSTADIEV